MPTRPRVGVEAMTSSSVHTRYSSFLLRVRPAHARLLGLGKALLAEDLDLGLLGRRLHEERLA